MDATLLSRAILVGAAEAGLDISLFEDALAFASYVHRSQTRAQRADMPRVHYVEHPARVSLRLMRAGCVNQDVLLAAILHDTVEDHSREIASAFAGSTGNVDARALALNYIGVVFGTAVMVTVSDVSNPIFPSAFTKAETHVAYRVHVRAAIESLSAFLVKFSDFIDNAFSLKHTLSPSTLNMVRNLVAKYTPLVDDFEERLNRPDVAACLSYEGLVQMKAQIVSGRKMLAELATI
jgi:(p)ppGpp synthase/HD superfamily hydrolase